MKKTIAMIIMVVTLLSLFVIPVAAKEGTEGDELQVLQPEQLEIHLGAELASAQFSLKTDAGMYPGTVVADEHGVLRMEIGGSKAYVLTRLTSAQPTTLPEEAETESGTEPAAGGETEAPSESETGNLVPAEGAEKPEQKDNAIPTTHIILFAGGAVLCIIFLVASFVLKRRRERFDEEDDDEA